MEPSSIQPFIQKLIKIHKNNYVTVTLKVTTVLRTYKGRTYKGQFTFFKKIYCARIRDKF